MIPLNDTPAKSRADQTFYCLFFLLFTVPWVVLGSCAHCYAFALLGRPWFLAYCSSSRGTEKSVRQAEGQDGETLLVLSSLTSVVPPQVSTCPPSPSGVLCTQAAPPTNCWRDRAQHSKLWELWMYWQQGWKSDLLLWQPGLLHWWKHHTSPLLQLWGVDKEQHGEFPCSTKTGAEEADRRHQQG